MLRSEGGVKTRLEVERERLIQGISRLSNLSRTRTSSNNDPADSAVDASENALNSALLETQSRHLAMVEEALHRLESGSYGICEGCGQPIDPARLEVLPEALLCVECKARLEMAA